MKGHNVLEIINLFGSAKNFIGGQFSYLGKRGYNMHLICSDAQGLDEFANQQGIKYKAIRLERQVSVWNDIKAYFTVCKYIKDNKIDTVIAHQYKARLIAMLAASTMRVPNRIIFAHGALYDTMRGFRRKVFILVDRLVAAMAHKVVCVSPSVAKIRLRDNINKAEKQFLLNKGTCGGIDTQVMFNPARHPQKAVDAMKEGLGLKDSDFIVGFCGRLVRDKGVIELIEGFRRLKEAHLQRSLKLLIIGQREVRDAIPQITMDIILNDTDIVFTGYVNREDIAKYYSMMNVFILPSYREGYPTVVLEAMAMGTPCIVSRSTGCIDSIVEGVNGIYTDIDSNSIKENIERFFDNSFRDNLAVNCRSYIVDNYDHNKVWPFVADIIEK